MDRKLISTLIAAYCCFAFLATVKFFVMKSPFPDYEDGEIARSLVEGRGFSRIETPWDFGGNLASAQKVPVHPAILALNYYLFGETGKYTMLLIQGLFGVLNAYFIFVLTIKLTGARNAAWLAMLLFFMSPFLLVNYLQIGNMAIGSLALLGVTYYVYNYAYKSLKKALFGGILLGLASLSLATIITILPVTALWIGIQSNKILNSKTEASQRVAVFCLGLLLCLTPWTIRNYMVFERFVPLTSTFPMELRVGNHPLATGGMYIDEHDTVGNHVFQENLERAKGLNEVEGYKLIGKDAIEFIKENPLKFLELRVKAFKLFWYPEVFTLYFSQFQGGKWIMYKYANILLLVGAVLGIFFYWKSYERIDLLLLVGVPMSVCALYTLTHADIGWRYRSPLDQFLLFFLAIFLMALGKRLRLCRLRSS